MKNIFIFCTAACLLAAGCKKGELNITNPNIPTTEQFWKTGDDAQKGINATYSTFHRVGLARNQFFITIIRSDEGFSTSPNPTLINNFDAFIINDYNLWETRTVWQDLYAGINRANQVLDNVPAITMDDATKQQLLGEAKFLRGFFYYYLATYWGNVPLQLHTSLATDYPPTSPQADVYAQAEKDFTDAAAVLPATYNSANIGRATKGAAYGMLGKCYMQQKAYSQAQAALQNIVEGTLKSNYDLVTDFRSNFIETAENNRESVFEFQNAANPTDNHDDDTDPRVDNLNYGSSIPPFFAPRPIGFTDGQARRWTVWEFLQEKTTDAKRDPRLAASFIYDSTDERGPNFTQVYGATWISRNYSNVSGDPVGVATNHTVYFRKLLNDATMNGEVFHSGNNYRYLRYADVLLLYAEALNAQGQTATAYQYVDRVRQRAGLAKLSTVKPGLNQADFLNQLKHERLTELVGEGHRWEDLYRWGDLGPQLASRDAGFANFVKGKHEFLPIIQFDLDVNPNLKQNPGW
ncbi:MAG: RagB/SusD family nutrient uptake outer membrane protein [Williamsia sp.]|nr:RagB/SusD family nutrient uptake outer membrane protein [Williamsia sp.]